MRWGWSVVGCLVVTLGGTPPRCVDALPVPALLLIDADSGAVLREEQADSARPQGSLSQLMVLLLSLEEADLRALPLDVPVTVSSTAGSGALAPANVGASAGVRRSVTGGTAPPSGMRIPLRTNREYLLSDLLKAIVVASANDATIAVAEAIAGSVPACLEVMNARAQKLGMDATVYSSVGGITPPGVSATDRTTARDLARLAQALIRHPRILQWAALSGIPFDQGVILLHNANQLLGKVPGVDGLQGSMAAATRAGAASYSIVATAQRGALRLIAVVLDAADSATRYASAADLLEWGFSNYERLQIARKGEPLNIPIRIGNAAVAQFMPVAGESFSLLHRRDEEHELQARYQLPALVFAPLRREQPVGEIIVEERGQLLAVVPLVSPAEITSNGVLSAALP